MQPEDLTRKMQVRPFKPFRLVMTDGTTIDVKHPDSMIVTRRTAILGIGTNPAHKIFDELVEIDVLHVIRLEAVESSASPNG
jgi:hypothetical protein